MWLISIDGANPSKRWSCFRRYKQSQDDVTIPEERNRGLEERSTVVLDDRIIVPVRIILILVQFEQLLFFDHTHFVVIKILIFPNYGQKVKVIKFIANFLW